MKLGSALLAATALVAVGSSAALAKPGDPGREKVVAAIKADHDASIERLRKWIQLPTIANMNINHREGAEYMKQLVLDAGFQQAKTIDTAGVPGVFATLNDVKFGGWAIVELDRVPNPGRTPKEAAEVNRRYLVETMHETI